MAHPLTQLPPNSLPFPAAARPSPLGFGFGQPTASTLGFGGPSVLAPGGGFGFGFGSSTPLKKGFTSPRPFNTASPSSSKYTPSRPSPSALKRPRRSLSPSPPTASSSAVSLGKRKEKDDALAVEGQQMQPEPERKPVRKLVKRSKKEEEKSAVGPEGVDVGVLLATLPPSSHLDILLHLLESNPSLSATVLARLPQPDLNQCLQELEKSMDKIKRAGGLGGPNLDFSGLAGKRIWERSHVEVASFCKISSTYVHFFSAPPNSTQQPTDPTILFPLLHTLTVYVYSLLLLIPTEPTHPSTATPLLDLANLVLTTWTHWISALSTEVNQRGGMYPHPMVNSWSEGMDRLANGEISIWQTTATESPLVFSFRSAFIPIRDRFVNELGWLIGRRPVGGDATSDTGHLLQYSQPQLTSINNSTWRGNMVAAGGDEDEEL
ncbi:hypothetical protein P7C73_g6084, partial [Tremellales sp. Uapishka_1]